MVLSRKKTDRLIDRQTDRQTERKKERRRRRRRRRTADEKDPAEKNQENVLTKRTQVSDTKNTTTFRQSLRQEYH